jgi:hypothetical protein
MLPRGQRYLVVTLARLGGTAQIACHEAVSFEVGPGYVVTGHADLLEGGDQLLVAKPLLRFA